jgi:hypothetical protein
MEQCAHARAAQRVLADEIAQKKPVIGRYGTGCGYGPRHPAETLILVNGGVYRALTQSITRNRSALGRGIVVVDVCEHLVSDKCFCCEERTDDAHKEGTYCEWSVDRNLRLRMKYVKSCWELCNRVLGAAINIRRLRTAELSLRETPVYRKQEITGRKRSSCKNAHKGYC